MYSGRYGNDTCGRIVDFFCVLIPFIFHGDK